MRRHGIFLENIEHVSIPICYANHTQTHSAHGHELRERACSQQPQDNSRPHQRAPYQKGAASNVPLLELLQHSPPPSVKRRDLFPALAYMPGFESAGLAQLLILQMSSNSNFQIQRTRFKLLACMTEQLRPDQLQNSGDFRKENRKAIQHRSGRSGSSMIAKHA